MPLWPDQAAELEKGADIIVATPGRLIMFLERAKVQGCVPLLMFEAEAKLRESHVMLLNMPAPRVCQATSEK